MKSIQQEEAIDRVALLTPEGRGAIATIAVDGPNAVARVDRFFRPAGRRCIGQAAPGKILFGRWRSAGGEELVVCRRDRQTVEMHAHGGPAAYEALLADLVRSGCRRVAWSEWLARRDPDRLRAAAATALAAAETGRTAAILLDQFHGALTRAVDQVRQTVADSAADRATQSLAAILRYASLGQHLTEPWRVVLTGRPNVGKSSLINALLGYRRALVYHQPGTTRDVLTAVTAVDGWPIELADTAGQCTATDPIEAAGIERADDRLDTADAVVIVLDASQPLHADDRRLMARYASALPVYNKIDLAAQFPVPAGAIGTSALSGAGIDRLVAAIADHLVPDVPPAGAAVPFEPRHVHLLRQTLDAMRTGQPATACALLQSL